MHICDSAAGHLATWLQASTAFRRNHSLPLGFLVYGPMPVVFRIDGLRVVIWPNDHRPAHVHVKGPAGEAVFNLNCPGGPPELRESYGFRLPDVNRIEAALAEVVPTLCEEWRKRHGDY